MKKYLLLIIYLLSTFSISAMNKTLSTVPINPISKTIINIQNNTTNSIIFSYNNSNDTLINPNEQESIVLPKTIEEFNLNTYLHIPYALPVTFKIGQNAKIKSGNTIT